MDLFCSWIFLMYVTRFMVGGHGDHGHHIETTAPGPTAASSRLLVISLDGFRYDYVNRGLPNMLKLASEGVRAKSMTSSYITKTFPNHLSIITGLYEESHGIIANRMIDPVWNDTFHMCSEPSCGRWYGGQPIWQVNEVSPAEANSSRRKRHAGHAKPAPKAFHKSGVIYWPGIGAHINNFTTSHEIPFTLEGQPGWLSFRKRIDHMLSWFTDGINLGLLYYEQPDEFGHRYGPESDEVTDVLKEIDKDIGYLMEELEERNMEDINVMIVSDHGFADVEGAVYLNKCEGLNITKFDVTENDPIVFIWPHEGVDVDTVYKQLNACQGIVVHRKDSPELKQYHYNSNRRVPPIVVVSERSADGKSGKSVKLNETKWNDKGNHGWNSTWDRMQAVFIARGPVFKKGYYRNSTFENVNLYPLMCEILGLICPPSNGSFDVLSELLAKPAGRGDVIITLTVTALLCALVGGILIVGVCKNYSCNSSYSYNSRTYHNPTYNLAKPNGLSGLHEATTLLSSDSEF